MTISTSRRHLLRHLGALGGAAGLGGGLAGALAALSAEAQAASADYRAVVVIYLSGGADGLDMLIPTDGAYSDYAKARGDIALPKDSLIKLDGSSAGHTFGVPPTLKELAPIYNSGRLAFIANAGALIKPTTAAEVLARTASVPPFMFSHAEQTSYIQGWMGDADPSGWAGRAMELMPAAYRKTLPVVSYAYDFTLLLGKTSRVTQTNANMNSYWGAADLSTPSNAMTRTIESMSRTQSRNHYEAEYARTMGATFQDAISMISFNAKAVAPTVAFPNNQLGTDLRALASMLPVYKSQGVRRQVLMVNFAPFDTHVKQRGSGDFALDTLFAQVGPAIKAFDDAVKAAGMDQNVVTFCFTEFGRTLTQASGGGTDHAWGNHWFVMGGPVQGRQVAGTFPTLVPGGPDDGDPWKKGRLVPTTSTDQVGASLMSWLGLPADQFHSAFPNLANFSKKTVQLLNA